MKNGLLLTILVFVAILYGCGASPSDRERLTQEQQMVVNDIKYELRGKDIAFETWKVDTIKQVDSIEYGRYSVRVNYDSAGNSVNRVAVYLLRLNDKSIKDKYISNHK